MCKLSFLLRYKDSKNNLLLPDKKSIHPHKCLNLTILLLLSNQYCTVMKFCNQKTEIQKAITLIFSKKTGCVLKSMMI